jgi:hypothetical protein
MDDDDTDDNDDDSDGNDDDYNLNMTIAWEKGPQSWKGSMKESGRLEDL